MEKKYKVLSFFIASIFLFGFSSQSLDKERKARMEFLKGLIETGSDIDQAVEILKKSDFKIVQGKIKPTKNGDYYSVIVLLIKDYKGPSLRNTLYEVTGWSIFYDDFDPYAEMKADLKGKIYLIE